MYYLLLDIHNRLKMEAKLFLKMKFNFWFYVDGIVILMLMVVLKRIGWGYIASFDLSIGSNESRWITNVEMPNLYNNHLLSFSFGESGIYLLPFNGEFLQKHMISKFAFSLFLQRT